MSSVALLDRDAVATTAATVETLEPLTPHRYRLTVTEYHLLGESGIFDEESRIELIQGDLIAMPPIGERHASKTRQLNRLFSLQVGDTAIVDVQNPVMLDAHSEPQPDMVLLKPRPDFYESAHPRAEDVLLLIEVSDSTLRYDRDTKVPLYAKAGIPEVWLLDLMSQRVAIYRHPSADGYRQIQFPAPEELISPSLLPELTLRIADLFLPTRLPTNTN
ncbi:MAG: Uma2 family endonuclease [Candidatus Contendobacter sp.]|nr:Uma2 family endonuclease [Candidatus Contendobacter sp.]